MSRVISKAEAARRRYLERTWGQAPGAARAAERLRAVVALAGRLGPELARGATVRTDGVDEPMLRVFRTDRDEAVPQLGELLLDGGRHA